MTTLRNRSMTVRRWIKTQTDTGLSYLQVTILSRQSRHRRGRTLERITVNTFMQTLRTQRWDDHRFYHHSLVNQSLHFVSAITFVIAYALLFVDPAFAAVLAWCVAMTTRQAGHFFFEPRGYDEVNQVTDAYKEEVKVGYNIRRKIVLMAIWVLIPATLWFAPSLGGRLRARRGHRLAVAGRGRPGLSRASAVGHAGPGRRPRLGHEDRDRPVHGHRPLPPRPAEAHAALDGDRGPLKR
jgi:hypothetical protein